jgi:GNAT superfamily N-acetyltransferase
VQVVALDDSTAGGWQALFEASGSSCFCRYWHFEGHKNEWLDRCFHHPDANREEQLELVHRGAPEARGLLAIDGDATLGWTKLVPRARLPKLRRQGAYRALDLGPDEGVWSIGCLLVHPAHRGHGVARALIEAAPEHACAWASADSPARLLEAYPRGTPPAGASLRLHDEEAWVGTQALFESCGFVRFGGEPAYPVMRRLLEPGARSPKLGA